MVINQKQTTTTPLQHHYIHNYTSNHYRFGHVFSPHLNTPNITTTLNNIRKYITVLNSPTHTINFFCSSDFHFTNKQ